MSAKKSFISTLFYALLMAISPIATAQYHKPLLVQDMPNRAELPRHFRSSSDIQQLSMPDLNTDGLQDLRMAGGGQFSVSALQAILQHLQTEKLTVIDLRQESHGLIDGTAVSWYAPHDAINAGKTPQQIEEDQEALLAGLAQEKHVNVYKIQKKTKTETIAKASAAKFPVHSVSSEEEFVESMNLQYVRLYVQDFHAPTPDQVDRFLAVVKALPKGEWVYFHCRAGVGRTTTFMAIYDMLHHAKKLSFEQILMRQAAIGGKDFNALPEQTRWKYPYALERLDFLTKFYDYARTNQDDYKTTWSEWLSAQQKK